jgi:hypothetical protein
VGRKRPQVVAKGNEASRMRVVVGTILNSLEMDLEKNLSAIFSNLSLNFYMGKNN